MYLNSGISVFSVCLFVLRVSAALWISFCAHTVCSCGSRSFIGRTALTPLSGSSQIPISVTSVLELYHYPSAASHLPGFSGARIPSAGVYTSQCLVPLPDLPGLLWRKRLFTSRLRLGCWQYCPCPAVMVHTGSRVGVGCTPCWEWLDWTAALVPYLRGAAGQCPKLPGSLPRLTQMVRTGVTFVGRWGMS